MTDESNPFIEALDRAEALIRDKDAEIEQLRRFRDQFNEVFDDAYKLAEAIVRPHMTTVGVFGVQPDHRFKEDARPLAVVADLAQAIAAARAQNTH